MWNEHVSDFLKWVRSGGELRWGFCYPRPKLGLRVYLERNGERVTPADLGRLAKRWMEQSGKVLTKNEFWRLIEASVYDVCNNVAQR